MHTKRSIDEMTVAELEQALYRKKRSARQRRLQRLKENGRVVEVDGLPAPDPTPQPHVTPPTLPAGTITQLHQPLISADGIDAAGEAAAAADSAGIQWRWIFNKFLLVVEIAAVFGLLAILFGLWDTSQELNQELASVQQQQSESLALPTAEPTPVIGVAILPSGHQPPVAGQAPDPREAGFIPEHLLPVIESYTPPPIPTPSPEQARLIEIPAIGVNHPIVQGDDWEQLKKGVGQHIGTALPGQEGNLVLAAHNDIFGEIFRYLDRLNAGDEIIVSTNRQSYTYIITAIDVVEPTDVHVMAPTEHASTTLISCYPYNVNTHRIVVFADLVTEEF